MKKPYITISADHPDACTLNTLPVVRQTCLILVVMVSAVVLCGWLSPAAGKLLPVGWAVMKANTALCILLCTCSVALLHPRMSPRATLVGRSFAAAVILVAAAVIYEYLSGRGLRIDTMLASDALSEHPGRMSLHSAFCLLLMGVILLCIRARKELLSRIVDALTLFLVFLILVYFSGYCFGALHLFGTSMQDQISPQTLFCLFLLTGVVFNERAKSGLFSVLLGDGIAGKTSRLALPFALTLPFLTAVLLGLAVKNYLMQMEYATAFASSILAMLFFSLTLLLSRRISGLEQSVRQLSLRDDLTSLYNRRGFYLLAARDLQLANRSGRPFSVLFLDVDNLKLINDRLGHETGSQLLKEFAVILSSTIRITDIAGRIGGDEFVIAGGAQASEIELVAKRIEDAIERINAGLHRSYVVSYSMGHVTSQPGVTETLEDLLHQADKIMYKSKRDKLASRADHAAHDWDALGGATREPVFVV